MNFKKKTKLSSNFNRVILFKTAKRYLLHCQLNVALTIIELPVQERNLTYFMF